MSKTILGPDGKARCAWCASAPEFLWSASTSAESLALSKELKRQGWKLVGPTTVYAFMQAMGLINDHVEGCVFRATIEGARKKFKQPGADTCSS